MSYKKLFFHGKFVLTQLSVVRALDRARALLGQGLGLVHGHEKQKKSGNYCLCVDTQGL